MVRLWIIRAAGDLKRAAVGVEGVTRFRADRVRHGAVGFKFCPDHIAAITRNHAMPIQARRTLGDAANIIARNPAFAVSDNAVLAGMGIELHHRVKLFEGARAHHAIALLRVADFLHRRPAHGKGAVFVFHHRAMATAQDRARHLPAKRPPELDQHPGARCFKLHRLAVEQIGALVARRQGELVDVNQVGIVHRGGDAQRVVDAQMQGRGTRKRAAGEVQAFIGRHRGFVPGQRPFQRLMRIDDQPGFAIGRFRRRDRKGVRAKFVFVRIQPSDLQHLPARRIAFRVWAEQVAEHAAHAVKHRHIKLRQRDDIGGGDGEQVWLELFGMARGVEVQPRHIAFQQRPGRGVQIRCVAGLGNRARAGPLEHERALRFGFVGGDHVAAAGEPQRILDGGEIVLGMGVGQRKGRIGIPPAPHPRNAILVAPDQAVIAFGGFDRRGRIKRARLQRQEPQAQCERGSHARRRYRSGAQRHLTPNPRHRPLPRFHAIVRPKR